MYCSKCGTQIDDDSLFCPNCGTRVETSDAPASTPIPPVQADTPVSNAPKKKLSKGALIGIIAGAAAIVVLVVLLIVLLGGGSKGGRSPEATVESYLKSAIGGDFEKAADYGMPDVVLEAFLKENDITKSEYRERLKQAEQMYNLYLSMSEENAAMKKTFQCRILSTEQLDRDDLYDLDDDYHNEFNTPYGTIEDAVRVYFTISYTSPSGELQSQRDEVEVVKIGGRWYIDYDSEYSFIDLVSDFSYGGYYY